MALQLVLLHQAGVDPKTFPPQMGRGTAAVQQAAPTTSPASRPKAQTRHA